MAKIGGLSVHGQRQGKGELAGLPSSIFEWQGEQQNSVVVLVAVDWVSCDIPEMSPCWILLESDRRSRMHRGEARGSEDSIGESDSALHEVLIRPHG